MSVKAIIIPRGKHKYKKVYWHCPRFYPKQILKKFMFTKSCLYDLKDEDQHDVNKLFGMSFNLFPSFNELVPHHINSARFGWRPIIEEEVIQIVAYEYVECERRPTKVITEVKVNDWYEYLMYYLEGRLYYIIRNAGKFYAYYESDFPLRKEIVMGYELDVYFGGNETAPHTITIFEK